MEYHFNVEQCSSEWFELKHGVIGGTRSKGLFVNSDTLFYELLAEHTEPYDEDSDEGFSNDHMERGKELEPQARLELCKYTGIDFVECGFIINPISILGISPDGITHDFKIQCEIKCPDAKKHLRTCVENEIPLDNINQCLHAFTVNDNLTDFYFLSFRPESIKPMFVKHLTRESEINIGTKAKPILKKVNDCVTMAKAEAIKIEALIKETINKLKF